MTAEVYLVSVAALLRVVDVAAGYLTKFVVVVAWSLKDSAVVDEIVQVAVG